MGAGLQVAQTTHAALHFFQNYPEITQDWIRSSNYIACLAVKDENQLLNLLELAQKRGIKHYAFYEPDINNQLTAICFEPTQEARKITSNIPLAGKEVKNV